MKYLSFALIIVSVSVVPIAGLIIGGISNKHVSLKMAQTALKRELRV